MQPTHSQQKILNRQSVPAFATAAQHTLHNGRMVLSGAISPQTSPQPPQHGFGASSSSISSFHVPSSSSSGYSGGSSMLNPAAAASGMMWNRRASLGVPKSPSFFESQQLALSQSEQGIASASSAQASPTNASSTATTSSIAAGQHARKNSRHSRRISVSTRRESMEIMAGILPGMLNHGSTSPLPPSENASSKEMNRSSTAGTSSSSASSGILPYEQSVLLSSLAMEERQLSEEEERDDALARLEGRLSVRPDLIQLPDETTTSSIGNTGGGQQARLLSSTRQEKRNSWNPRDSWGTTSPFASNYNGNNNKGGNLDMLVEEEEEEEEEALVEEDEEAQETETETEREQDISATLEDEITASPKAGKRSRPGTLTFAPRKLSLSSSTASSEDRVISPPPSSATSTTHSSSVKIGSGAQQQATRAAPRPLSLMSSSSMGNLSNVSADVKLARRQSGLRSLTLTSPEHMLNGPSLATSPASATGSSGALARRRQSLLNSTVSPSSNPATSPTPSSGGGIRPFSISSTSSVLSPDVSFRSGFQFGSSTKEAQLQSLQQQQQQQVGGGLNRDGLPRPRKSFSTASSASNASSAISTPSRSAASSAPPTSGGATSGRPSLTYNNSSVSASAPLPPSSASSRFGSRRFSDLASPSSVGFGDLVMEESLLEEDEDDLEEGDGGVANGHTNILDGLSKDEQDEDESTQRLDRLSVSRPVPSGCGIKLITELRPLEFVYSPRLETHLVQTPPWPMYQCPMTLSSWIFKSEHSSRKSNIFERNSRHQTRHVKKKSNHSVSNLLK